jgi:hypothetical protein
MNSTIVQVDNQKGLVRTVSVDSTNEHTLRADLRKFDAELSFVQAQKFLKEGHGVHFDLDEKTHRFSVGYVVSKLN